MEIKLLPYNASRDIYNLKCLPYKGTNRNGTDLIVALIMSKLISVV